jgi:Ca-activated chloride channel homolog
MTKTHRGLAGALALALMAAACHRTPEQAAGTPTASGVASPQEDAPSVAQAAPKDALASSERGAEEADETARLAPAPPQPLLEAASPARAEAKAAAQPGVAHDGYGPMKSSAVAGRGLALRPASPPTALGAAGDFDTEAYDAVQETPFLSVKDAPLSTFSIDVDTASYSNVRRFLNQGQLPPSGAVRIEELINYFPYAYAEPTGDVPLSVTTELSDAPWNPEHRLLHVGLQGKHLQDAQLPPKNLVFLLDVSGSMESPNKLPLLKRSLLALTDTLSERDHVAIVVYAGASGLVLPSTSGDHGAQIRAALDRLEAGGSTNGAGGIELAYAIAEGMARPGTSNRVILATDGDFNVGVTSQSELLTLIEAKRRSGVYLSVLGFGMGNYKDSTLELLADKGNGNYAYIDSLSEARKVLVAEGGGTLMTLAKDVKLQLEFNPAKVAAYRLIGYENRRLAARDFNDDNKDAGELGAGHSVTALYELVPPGVKVDDGDVTALRYQTPRANLTGHGDELCKLMLRYKRPSSERSELLERAVADTGQDLARTSPSFRFSAAVAVFGMTLRESPERGSSSFGLARQLATGALGADPEGYRREFVSLVDAAQAMRR